MINPVIENDLKNMSLNDVNYADYIKENYIQIPDNATNGEMIKAMFNVKRAGIHQEYNGEIIAVTMKENPMFCIDFDADWWNSPYKK